MDHSLERAALVARIALHRFDKIGHEVVPLLHLNVNIGEGRIDTLAHGHEPVVDDDDPKQRRSPATLRSAQPRFDMA